MPENDIKTTADIFQFLPTFSPLKRHLLLETTSSGKPEIHVVVANRLKEYK